jgi:ribulose-phosphate 3-epimerase
MNSVKIAPSILSADLLYLEKQIKEVENNGADYIHVDVMDGQYVPNITFGPVIVKTLKRITELPLDVHLMIYNADRYIEDFVRAGAAHITVHQEALTHLHSTIQSIHAQNITAGVSLNPATPVNSIADILSDVDMVLVMSVNPGFGGQEFLEVANNKIRQLDTLRRENGYKYLIEVDGGINNQTTPGVVSAGADVLVAGNAIFAADNIGQSCRDLKQIAQESFVKSG